MQAIDLRAILRRTVSGFYGDLVTRRTGAAVRGGIEQVLAESDGDQAAVIDFSEVRCIDMSCADEIVAKLLVEHGEARYFVLRGISEAQRDAIESVLERRRLSVAVVDADGRPDVLGTIPDAARLVFGILAEAGAAAPDEVAERMAVPADTARAALEDLLERRLIFAEANGYRAVTA